MLRSSLLFVLLAFSASASAQEFDYNWLSFGYSNYELDFGGGAEVDGDAFGIEGSFAINDNVHVFADFKAADLDFDIDATQWSAGIGYNTPLSDSVDLVGQLSYEYIEAEQPVVGKDDENGLGLGLGLRFMAADSIELNAGIDYVDYGDTVGDETSLIVGGLYNFTQNFAVGLRGSFGDVVSFYSLTGRFYFGQ